MKDKSYSYKVVFWAMIGLLLSIIFAALTSCEKPIQDIADWECTNTVVRTIPGYIPDSINYITIYYARTGQEIAEMERNQIFYQIQEYNGVTIFIESKTTCHQMCE